MKEFEDNGNTENTEKKTEGQLLLEKLSYKARYTWEKAPDEEIKKAFDFCEEYKKFIDSAKTEREFTREAEKAAVSNGFVPIEKVVEEGIKLIPGMKVYKNIHKKAFAGFNRRRRHRKRG